MYQFQYNTFRNQEKMGCCDSRNVQPLIILRNRYGVIQLNAHFLAKFQAKYLRTKRARAEADMLHHSEKILKERLTEITKKQQIVEERFDEPLRIARSNPQKASQSELRYNMTLEEIIGLEGVRRKFEELKGIISANAKKEEKQMIEDVRMRFQLMEGRMKEKIINVELKQVSQDELRQIEQEFSKSKATELKIYQSQVDEQINRRISFDNYAKRFINIVPQEQLMTLTAQNQLPKLFRKDSAEPTAPSQNEDCCWCR